MTRPGRGALIGALIMAVLLAIYIVVLGWRAVQFVSTGEPVAVGIGVALVVLPALGAWALARELLFGFRSGRIVERMATEGTLPDDDLPRRASGRPLREAADAEFPRYRSEVEQNPDDWRAWFRLGLAYDASGDRRRARQAVRSAIALEMAERRSGPISGR